MKKFLSCLVAIMVVACMGALLVACDPSGSMCSINVPDQATLSAAHIKEINCSHSYSYESGESKFGAEKDSENVSISIHMERGYALGSLTVSANGETLSVSHANEYDCDNSYFYELPTITKDVDITISGAGEKEMHAIKFVEQNSEITMEKYFEHAEYFDNIGFLVKANGQTIADDFESFSNYLMGKGEGNVNGVYYYPCDTVLEFTAWQNNSTIPIQFVSSRNDAITLKYENGTLKKTLQWSVVGGNNQASGEVMQIETYLVGMIYNLDIFDYDFSKPYDFDISDLDAAEQDLGMSLMLYSSVYDKTNKREVDKWSELKTAGDLCLAFDLNDYMSYDVFTNLATSGVTVKINGKAVNAENISVEDYVLYIDVLKPWQYSKFSASYTYVLTFEGLAEYVAASDNYVLVDRLDVSRIEIDGLFTSSEDVSSYFNVREYVEAEGNNFYIHKDSTITFYCSGDFAATKIKVTLTLADGTTDVLELEIDEYVNPTDEMYVSWSQYNLEVMIRQLDFTKLTIEKLA